MGPSQWQNLNPVNYNCQVCWASQKIPNIAGRFNLINERECKCNGCNSVFEKKRFYKSYKVNAINVKSEEPTI